MQPKPKKKKTEKTKEESMANSSKKPTSTKRRGDEVSFQVRTTSKHECSEKQIPQCKILCSESFTRWLVWGASASAQELGKIGTFLCPHCVPVQKVHFLPSRSV